jgi:hypothetical protein
MSVQDNRRRNLALAFANRPIPPEEKSYFSQLLNGKSPFGEKAARRIEDQYGLAELSLDLDPPGVLTLREPEPPLYSLRRRDQSIEICRLDVTASMGPGYTEPSYEDVITVIRVNEQALRSLLANIPYSAPANLRLISAYGDSMQPTFYGGDLLLVDIGVDEVKLDAVYVLHLAGELYIKRLQRRPDRSLLMLSDNQAYEPYRIEEPSATDFRVLGRVLLAWNARRL